MNRATSPTGWARNPDGSQGLSPQYIAGFFDGEGCAMVLTIRRITGGKVTYRFRPVIKIHQKTQGVLTQIMNTVGCGHIDKAPSGFAYIINGLDGVLNFADNIGPHAIVKHNALVSLRAVARLQKDNHGHNQPYSRLLFGTLLNLRDDVFRANQQTRTGLKQKYNSATILAEQSFVDDIQAWQKNRMRGIHHE